MKRRTLLRSVLGLVAGAGLAGCSGAGGEVPVTAEAPPPSVPTETQGAGGPAPSNPPSGSAVSISDFGGEADADGSLVATVTVTNESDRQQVRLVRATVAINDLQTSGERFVVLSPRETRTVRIHLDVGFDAWNASGSLTPQVIRRTPTTPIPTDRADTDARRRHGERDDDDGLGNGNGLVDRDGVGHPDRLLDNVGVSRWGAAQTVAGERVEPGCRRPSQTMASSRTSGFSRR